MYASATLSLAALEYFVHVKGRQVPFDLVAIPLVVPDYVIVIDTSEDDLPPDWRLMPGPVSTQAIGSRWAEERRSAVMSVPSAIIPEERNYLLNPLHAGFQRLRIGEPSAFAFDPRMWK